MGLSPAYRSLIMDWWFVTPRLLLTIALLHAGCATPREPSFAYGMAAYDRGDYATTLREWTMLAERGDATAQHHLGWLYVIGRGVPQDYEQAVRWFRKAAEQGDTDAQTNLGSLYLLGEGVPQDLTEALKWLRSAAVHGHPLAQTKLGIMYEDGRGCSRTLSKRTCGSAWRRHRATSWPMRFKVNWPNT